MYIFRIRYEKFKLTLRYTHFLVKFRFTIKDIRISKLSIYYNTTLYKAKAKATRVATTPTAVTAVLSAAPVVVPVVEEAASKEISAHW